MSILFFNDIPSTSLNARIASPPDYKAPNKRYSSVTTINKTGTFFIHEDDYDNVEITYHMSLDASSDDYSFYDVSSAIMSWLNPIDDGYYGYYKLMDTYDPNHFRWAKIKSDTSISNILNKAGTFDLTFECKPQRFLVSGEKPITINAQVSQISKTTIYNPTSQIAVPLITFSDIEANGNILIENGDHIHKIKATEALSNVTVDSLEETCYTTNGDICSTKIEMYKVIKYEGDPFPIYDEKFYYDYPLLYPGESLISIDAEKVSEFTIIPNWWEL